MSGYHHQDKCTPPEAPVGEGYDSPQMRENLKRTSVKFLALLREEREREKEARRYLLCNDDHD